MMHLSMRPDNKKPRQEPGFFERHKGRLRQLYSDLIMVHFGIGRRVGVTALRIRYAGGQIREPFHQIG